ncbi:hypothetical protein SR39_04945 [Methylobacterium radiotolerans]|nr:hypothetical protein SR39_04945 [Methylobacterium radiotolerans]
MASASAASATRNSAFGRRKRTIAWICTFSAWPEPATVFLIRLGAYSNTGRPARAGTSSAIARAWPSLSVAWASLLTKVSSTATSSGRTASTMRPIPSNSSRRRRASGSSPSEVTTPQSP